jgi:glycosyltransferase involved in cell wall biosynthesis
MADKLNRKIKLLRVVTQSEVVPWHLKNFIERSEKDYDLYIVGNEVTRFNKDYPNAKFINVKILRKTSLFYDSLALLKLLFVMIRIRPQIVHSIMPKAGFLTAIAGWLTLVPIRIHTFTGQVWATKTGFSKSFYRLMDKLVFKLNTNCLTDSPSQSNFLAKNGFLVNDRPIQYLGKGSFSGVNLKIFDLGIVRNRHVLRKELGINEDDFVFIFLARKSKVKGIQELIESFAKVAFLPKVKLLFIGPDESQGLLDILLEEN